MSADTQPQSVPAPELSVVAPSHDRPLRLRWLLNALEEQTLPPDRWEVVIGHDSSGPETEELLRTHPLAKAGVLRHCTLEPGSAPPGANRNAAWRMARADTVVFTDDDCRPPPGWLESVLAAVRQNPGAVVQGQTIPDPDEQPAFHKSPWRHTQLMIPPTPYAQTCNIAYPREVLQRFGGFSEDVLTGEDTDLALRARAEGVEYVGDRRMLTYHAIDTPLLYQRLRGLWRWRHLPQLVKRHPELRDDFTLWIFWKPTHVWLPLVAIALIRGRRSPAFAALALPWMIHSIPHHGNLPRARIRALMDLPGHATIDATEIAVLVYGSVKYRTLFL